MSDFYDGMLWGAAFVLACVIVSAVFAFGIGYSIHRAGHYDDDGSPYYPPEFDQHVNTALTAVADIEDADVRLWELENGWATG